MKLPQTELFDHLKLIIEKLGVTYQEHSFRATSIRVQSGLCLVRGDLFFIMDKRKKLRDKNRILGRTLSQMDLDTVHIPPMVREFIEGER
ncbi:hypothetical protein [Desulfoluna sp.]|uniref:hypothetical protein n=1 Tax=Desulfoluna sp. TaxID=2045199 RepID=UPI0026326199|nr:hypothetical protein [Desulfoluna sp.]